MVQQICVNLLTSPHPPHAPSTAHGTRTLIVKLTYPTSTYMNVHVEHVLLCKSYLLISTELRRLLNHIIIETNKNSSDHSVYISISILPETKKMSNLL